MRRDRPSTTAALVGFGRAVGVLGEAPDPLAPELVGGVFRPLLALYAAAGAERGPLRAIYRAAALGLVDHVTLRTFAIDRAVVDAMTAGIRQVVILGAGLDARAYRMAELAEATVLEVDHPASQRWKRERIAGRAPLAKRVVHVAIDFERERLGDVLASAEHDAYVPTLWLWEGVTMYLPHEATRATLGELARRSAAGSRLVVSYLAPRRPGWRRPITSAARLFLASLGEPIRGEIRPEEMRDMLDAHGFRLREDASSAEWARDYRTDAWPSTLFRRERVAVAVKA